MERKYYRVTEKEMELIGSIINQLIDRSAGARNGEWSVDNSGFIMDSKSKSWGFVCGDDIIDDDDSPEEAEEEICESLKFVLDDCLKEGKSE